MSKLIAVCVMALGFVSAATAEGLPEDLKSGLVLWLDAGKNTFEGTFHEKSGVIHWCDVRETFGGESFADHAFLYPCASATTTTPYTNLKGGLVPPTLATDDKGLKYVDFGLYGKYDGANQWMFVENGKGALQNVTSRSLFCVVSFGKANNFGTVFGHIGGLTTSSGAKGYYWKRQPGSEGDDIARDTDIMQLGETRLDGKRIDPEHTTYSFEGRQVFSQVGPYKISDESAPVFNTFFNDRNQGTDTQGGGRLSEVLVYDRVLTCAERVAVEKYLSEKWLGAAFVEEKTAVKGPQDVDPVGRVTYESDVRIPTTSLSNQVITVSGATAAVSAPMSEGAMDEPVSPFVPGDNYVSAGGFEEPRQDDCAFKSVVPTGWTKPSGSSYVGTPGSGIYSPTGASVPEGRQFVAIQGSGVIQQTIRVPADGLYKLSFYMSHRNGRGEEDGDTRIQVKIGDDQVYYGCVSADSRGGMDVFKYYAAELPPLKKGVDYVLKIGLINVSTKDVMLLCDDVRITPIAAGEFVYIPNAGFESAGRVAFDKTSGGDAAVQGGNFATSIFSWEAPVFSINNKSCHARVAQNSIYYYWDYNGAKFDYTGEPADERDYRKLVLSRAGFASQTVSVPRPGRLRFSMRYSRGYIGAGGHVIGVTLGGTEVARTPAVTDALTTKTLVSEFDWSGAGPSTLMVSNVLPVAVGDYYSVVDDLRLEYIDSVIYEQIGPDGQPVAATLADGESAGSTLNVAADGFYYAAITTAGLAIEDKSANGVYNSYKYYPAKAQVTVDGVAVADYAVETPDFARLGVRLPYLKAGSHQIAVKGVADAITTLGKVRVLKAELLPLEIEDADFAGKDFKFRLVNGAKLDLDYLGTAECRGLKVEGVGKRGIVTAESCDSILGPGTADVKPDGAAIILR